MSGIYFRTLWEVFGGRLMGNKTKVAVFWYLLVRLLCSWLFILLLTSILVCARSFS